MIKMIQKLKNKKGFTLVELIVVIAIIAILTAVIVPLIARYSAQAQYTTLQDAAQTISNSANNALSDGNQVSALNIKCISGAKSGGVLTIYLGGAIYSSNGTTTSASHAANAASKGEERAAERLVESLATTLPDTCAFYAEINQSAVAGVVYTNAAVTISDGDVSEVEGFDKAYQLTPSGGSAGPIGASGKYTPTVASGASEAKATLKMDSAAKFTVVAVKTGS